MTEISRHDPALLERIARLKAQRRSCREIAQELGLHKNRVAYLNAQFGFERHTSKVDIGNHLLVPYQDEAMRRGIPLQAFIRLVLRNVLQDKLFDAVIGE